MTSCRNVFAEIQEQLPKIKKAGGRDLEKNKKVTLEQKREREEKTCISVR
jgi:hypothetical protein